MSQTTADTRDAIEAIENELRGADIPEDAKKKIYSNLIELKNEKLNILITGATGAGKSSTINALFNKDVAMVGHVDPETMEIEKYPLRNLNLWDTPGLGDGVEADARHSKAIKELLHRKGDDGKALIDLVLVVVDGSSRDMGTSYDLINNVIIPNMADKSRILIAINQCDIALKGKSWDVLDNRPEESLVKFLDDKATSVQRRIYESTGVNIEPIYYSAEKHYNLSKLLYFIVKHTPSAKRVVYLRDNINHNEAHFKSDDGHRTGVNYKEETAKTLWESVKEGAQVGSDVGGELGRILGGRAGEVAGRVVGGVVGAIGGAIGKIFGGL